MPTYLIPPLPSRLSVAALVLLATTLAFAPRLEAQRGYQLEQVRIAQSMPPISTPRHATAKQAIPLPKRKPRIS